MFSAMPILVKSISLPLSCFFFDVGFWYCIHKGEERFFSEKAPLKNHYEEFPFFIQNEIRFYLSVIDKLIGY